MSIYNKYLHQKAEEKNIKKKIFSVAYDINKIKKCTKNLPFYHWQIHRDKILNLN